MSNASQPTEFVRVLARADVLALAFGAMIGWGWIVLTGGAILDGGSLGAIIAFIIGGIAVLLVGLTYAELAAAMPQVGGEHVYSYRALGHFASFVCTWSIVLGYVSVASFEAVALPTVVQHLFPGYAVGDLWTVAGWEVKASWVAVGVIGSLVMMVINYLGISTAALLQKVVTGLILIAGVMFVTGSLFTGDAGNMQPLFASGEHGAFGGIVAVLVLVPFLFVGFDVIPQAAEEIDLPFRDIGKVLVLSVLMAVAWYTLIVLGTSLMLDNDALGGSTLSVPDAMQAVFDGAWAGNLMVLAGIAGIITSWNAFYIGGSRAIYALAHSGMLPAFLGKLHPRYKTTHQRHHPDRRALHPGAVLRPPGAGVAGRCRWPGDRHRLSVRIAVVSDPAPARAGDGAPLPGQGRRSGRRARGPAIAGHGVSLPAGQSVGACAGGVGGIRRLDDRRIVAVRVGATALRSRGRRSSHPCLLHDIVTVTIVPSTPVRTSGTAHRRHDARRFRRRVA